MQAKCVAFLCLCAVLPTSWTACAEVSIEPVALYGWPALGLGNSARFTLFNCFSLADDERVAFTANSTDASFHNVEGLWAGLPGSLNLIAYAGEPAPGARTGVTFYYFDSAHIGNCQQLAFLAELQGPGVDTNNPGSFWVAAAEPSQAPEPLRLVVPTNGVCLEAKTYLGYCNASELLQCGNLVACGVLVCDTNGEAILAGPDTNWVLVAQDGQPAPGTTDNFGSLASTSDMKSLTPDGRIAFPANLANGASGVWFGSPGAIQPVALSGQPAPAALGGGYRFGPYDGQEVEANGQGELAFVMSVVNTNYADVAFAGPPGALRVVAESGQPAPGIPGSIFTNVNGSLGVFGDVVIGSDGSVAFVASFSTTGYDYGLWLAAPNGTPQLIARTGGQAPGTPSGVVFTPSFQYLPPFDEFYMNASNQIVFHANLSGPGVGSSNSSGIWLAQPDGTVSLIVRAGDKAAGQQLGPVSLGYYIYLPPNIAGPEDGRRTPINRRGDVLFSSGQGLFLARNGIIVNAQVAGGDILLSFPTLPGKNYRVDYKSSLSGPTWSVAVPSVAGTGENVTVTNKIPAGAAGFYRVARTN